MSRRVLLTLAGLIANLSFSAPAGLHSQSPTQQAPQPRIAVETTNVVVDVVVRDRRGHPVTDLTVDDFEVYEDGVRQQVTSFSMVAPGAEPAVESDRARAAASPVSPAPGAPAAGTPEATQPTVVALVFDRLSEEGRAFAHRAATAYLDEARPHDTPVGIFAIDLSLKTLQPYTTNSALLKQAVDRAATLARGGFKSPKEESSSIAQVISEMGSPTHVPAPESSVAGVGQIAEVGALQAGQLPEVGDRAAKRMRELLLNMVQAYETLARDQQGHATTTSLAALLHSLGAMPGRKTMLLFSEGLSIPPAVQGHFDTVVDLANRSNVAIYTLGAAGLRARSTLAETQQQLNLERAIIEERREDGIMTKAMERTEFLLQSDPRGSLGRLADATGGFAIEDTNDLRPGLRRIADDARFHYLLGYLPANLAFDGKFRRIEVKLRRPDVRVRARNGYHAVRTGDALPVLAYEAPALAALDRTPPADAFPIHVGAFHMPAPERRGLTPVLLTIPTGSLGFRRDEERGQYRTDFAVVIRIRDQQNRIVRKLSQQYEIVGPLKQLDRVKQGEILFYRQPDLAAGAYSLEAVVHDAVTEKASVRVTPMEVPGGGDGPLISSLVLVRRSEKVPENQRDPANPLYYGDLLLYPSLGEPLRVGVDKDVSFYVIVYPGGRQDASALQARLELRQGDQPRGQAPLALGKPDAQGRIQHVGRLPLEGFAPGTYELRFSVTDGRQTHSRSATFTVAP